MVEEVMDLDYSNSDLSAKRAIPAHHMSLDNFAVFVDQEGGFFVASGTATEPAAGMGTAGLFRRL